MADGCGVCLPCGLESLLVVFGALLSLGFITTYVWSVSNGHVIPYLPYISDTGTTRPESCLFTMVVALGAALSFAIVIIRFQYIHYHFEFRKVRGLNMVALVTGILSSAGMIIVASFQATAVFPVHVTGAILAFGGGLVYAALNTALSFIILRRLHAGLHQFWLQLICVCLGVLCFVAAFSLGAVATDLREQDPEKYTLDPYLEPYFQYYVTSAVMEWSMSIVILLFFLTYYREFTRARVTFKCVRDDINPSELLSLHP